MVKSGFWNGKHVTVVCCTSRELLIVFSVVTYFFVSHSWFGDVVEKKEEEEIPIDVFFFFRSRWMPTGKIGNPGCKSHIETNDETTKGLRFFIWRVRGIADEVDAGDQVHVFELSLPISEAFIFFSLLHRWLPGLIGRPERQRSPTTNSCTFAMVDEKNASRGWIHCAGHDRRMDANGCNAIRQQESIGFDGDLMKSLDLSSPPYEDVIQSRDMTTWNYRLRGSI